MNSTRYEVEIDIIHMRDLRHGEVAVLLEGEYKGTLIVKTENDYAQILGENNGWSHSSLNNLSIRRLLSGETIKVKDIL